MTAGVYTGRPDELFICQVIILALLDTVQERLCCHPVDGVEIGVGVAVGISISIYKLIRPLPVTGTGTNVITFPKAGNFYNGSLLGNSSSVVESS